MGNQKTTNQIALTLKDFKVFDTNIPAENKPEGPLVNMSDLETGIENPYTVTVLAYLPSNQLNSVCFSPEVINKLELIKKDIYLTYYGVKVVTTLDRNQNRQLVDCRDFRVEFNCKEVADTYDLYYIQFEYQLLEDTLPVDAIIVRDDDEDPELDRGTVTMPAKPDQ